MTDDKRIELTTKLVDVLQKAGTSYAEDMDVLTAIMGASIVDAISEKKRALLLVKLVEQRLIDLVNSMWKIKEEENAKVD